MCVTPSNFFYTQLHFSDAAMERRVTIPEATSFPLLLRLDFRSNQNESHMASILGFKPKWITHGIHFGFHIFHTTISTLRSSSAPGLFTRSGNHRQQEAQSKIRFDLSTSTEPLHSSSIHGNGGKSNCFSSFGAWQVMLMWLSEVSQTLLLQVKIPWPR